MSYYFNTFLEATSFDAAVSQVTEALSQEGFGIISEIDVKATMKKKLDVDFKNYTILGACNPHFAHQAINHEDKIGALLPCNVLVIEQPDGRIEVAIADPVVSMMSVDNPELTQLSEAVREKLQRVITLL